MTALLPLALLWLASRRDAPTTPVFPMTWPTAASPPPPLPAFAPVATVPNAETATPLADLAQPVPDHSPPPVVMHPAKTPKPQTALQRAKAAAKKKLSPANAFKFATSRSTTSATSSKSVLELQQILNRNGAKLKADGLYGPKTATAWQALAKKRGLAATITRIGPKIAKVVTKTYDALKVPPIP